MPSTLRTIAAAAAVLSFGAFAAGCGGGASGADSRQDLDLQPIAAPGPTRSPVHGRIDGDPRPGRAARRPEQRAAVGLDPGEHRLGLHTGPVRRYAVGGQLRRGEADPLPRRRPGQEPGLRRCRRGRPGSVPAFLRGLTPVVLRADTRVTNHGFRDGSATSFQSVLQAGTAVLVDDHGAPRVRCACGNPLKAPNNHQGGWQRQGKALARLPWRPRHRRAAHHGGHQQPHHRQRRQQHLDRAADGRRRAARPQRPDIHIDPDQAARPAPPSPSASPSTSPPVSSSPSTSSSPSGSSPPPSPNCPTPRPTVTVTHTPTPTPPRHPPRRAGRRAGRAVPERLPYGHEDVTATPPVPPPSSPSLHRACPRRRCRRPTQARPASALAADDLPSSPDSDMLRALAGDGERLRGRTTAVSAGCAGDRGVRLGE